MNSSACYSLGRVEYLDGLDLMRRWGAARFEGAVSDTLFLLEHSPVITLGRGATRENIVVSSEQLQAEGVDVFETDRGGDVTYHGPGQLVGYPIFLLPPGRQDVRRYVRDVEEAIIRALASFGIHAHRESQWPGVWTKDASGELLKICAIGVHLSKWLTRHGFALNVNTEMSHFGFIVPCGIRQAGVVSMQQLLGHSIDINDVAAEVRKAFAEVFGRAFDEQSETREAASVIFVSKDHFVFVEKMGGPEEEKTILPFELTREAESTKEAAKRLTEKHEQNSPEIQETGFVRSRLHATEDSLLLLKEHQFLCPDSQTLRVQENGRFIRKDEARKELSLGAHIKALDSLVRD